MCWGSSHALQGVYTPNRARLPQHANKTKRTTRARADNSTSTTKTEQTRYTNRPAACSLLPSQTARGGLCAKEPPRICTGIGRRGLHTHILLHLCTPTCNMQHVPSVTHASVHSWRFEGLHLRCKRLRGKERGCSPFSASAAGQRVSVHAAQRGCSGQRCCSFLRTGFEVNELVRGGERRAHAKEDSCTEARDACDNRGAARAGRHSTDGNSMSAVDEHPRPR
jgi:hypothetical protein